MIVGGPSLTFWSNNQLHWEVLLWLELKLVAKRLPQQTRRSTVLSFTQRSVLKVAKMAKLVASPLVKLAASALVYTAQLVVALAAAPKRACSTP